MILRRHWAMAAISSLAVAMMWSGCATGVVLTPGEGGGGEGGEGGDGPSGPGPSGPGPSSSGHSSGAGTGGEGGSATPVIPCESAAQCAMLAGPCSLGACVNGFCEKAPANEFGACDDGLFCTENDICQNGACVAGTTKFCPSLDSCHLGVCDEDLDTCKNIGGNDGAQCDDGDLCTVTGKCAGGVCAKGGPVDCSIFNSLCSNGVCDPVVGCKAQPKNEGSACDNGVFNGCSFGQCQEGACVSLPKNEGASCDDGDFSPCTDGVCQNAACVGQPANDGIQCDDGMFSPCSQGQCQTGACVSLPKNNGTPCDDYQFCTINEACQNGACMGGQPNPCAPPGGCWMASCDENFDLCTSMPGNNGAACDDFSACTEGTTCSNGACIGGAPANDGVPCDDGASCTTGESCTAGLCGGGSGPTVYFAEDFADNSVGWLLGPEWQIGPAQASINGVFGSDPSTDHSSTADNGVAGVVIGGNAQTNVHGYYYLESPAFNTANAAGPVILSFFRWLNSDYDPYMHNVVEVYNGASWTTLWKSGGPPGVQDSPPGGLGWTYVQHDLTSYKNAAMRVRFGFDIGSGGVYTIGSWNVDDVLVADAPCPP